ITELISRRRVDRRRHFVLGCACFEVAKRGLPEPPTYGSCSSAPLLPLMVDFFIATAAVTLRPVVWDSLHKSKQLADFMNDDLSLAGVAFAAGLAALAVAGDHAAARSARTESSIEFVQSRSVGEPIMAIVSLRDQRVTIYDATGWILRAPVSSGQKGRETPAGIFSVIQKEAEHYSNLYDDAYMPHMQRITWSGIALHGRPPPGYPAAPGCIGLPYDFAARLFDLTRLGMRVIVAPTDVTPIEIAHPALFMPKPGADALAAKRAAEAEDVASKAATAK